MKLFVCDITELIAQQEDSVMWQQALSNLPAQRLEKVNRYKYHEDKARSIAAGFLLGYVLKTEYDLTAWELAYGEQGKPYLKDEEGIHFNLSHSKDYVVVCVDNHPCGVDIQKKKTLRPGFAERFFHPRELEFGLQTSGFACTDKSSDAVQEDVSPADKSSDAVQEDVSPADKSSDAVQ
ncbi:MAG: 4'-phosphopantetheinyl transferase family protein, partial [Lachnospiraceae bacterium]